jgi:hypothetical protein
MAEKSTDRANAVVVYRELDDGTDRIEVSCVGHGQKKIFDPRKVSAACTARATKQGFKTRIINAAAISRDETGKAATPGDKYDRIVAVIDHLESGTDDWEMRVAAAQTEGGLVLLGMVRASLAADTEAAATLVEALMAKRGVEKAEALKAFAGTVEVAEAVAAIRAERAAEAAKKATMSAGDLLDELVGK